MAIHRINHYEAREGRSEELQAVLLAILGEVRGAPGFLDCRLLQSHEEPWRFVVLEEWESEDLHGRAAGRVSADLIDAIVPLLRGRPSGGYFSERAGSGLNG
jgi:quinol monooxygenase YgiN